MVTPVILSTWEDGTKSSVRCLFRLPGIRMVRALTRLEMAEILAKH